MKIASHNHHPKTGFTLIEVIVVVAILVLLIAVLVPVISKSRNTARAGATLAQMQHIADACEHYYNDFGAYPGPVDDTTMNGVVTFTGAQNLFLGLTRRFYPGSSAPTITGQTIVALQPDATLPVWFDTNPGKQMANYATSNGPSAISVTTSLGTLTCTTFDPYLTPKPQEISGAKQSSDSNSTTPLDLVDFPCFVDYAFGDAARPILYYRQAYKYDAENAAVLHTTPGDTSNTTPFATKIVYDKAIEGHAAFYSSTNTLIDKDGTVATETSTPPLDTFVTHSINGATVPRGGFILISAGIDRVYGTTDDLVVAGGK